MIACRRHPPSLRSLCPQVPWSLDALAAKCIAFDPARRYARARDLAEDLRRFLDNLPMKHCPEPSVRERMRQMGQAPSRPVRLDFDCGIGAPFVRACWERRWPWFTTGCKSLSARVRYRVFDQDFTEIQFLLNTAGGSNEHLKTGLAKAAQTIAPFSAESANTCEPADLGQAVDPRGGPAAARAGRRADHARSARPRVAGESARRARGGSPSCIERAIERLDRAERIVSRRRRPRCSPNERAITPRSVKPSSPIVTVSGRGRSPRPPATT